MYFGPFEGSVVLLSREIKGERGRKEEGKKGERKKAVKRRHGA